MSIFTVLKNERHKLFHMDILETYIYTKIL